SRGQRRRVGQPDAKPGALSLAGAAGPDAPTVRFDQLATDRQAQAKTRYLLARRVRCASEWLEDAAGMARGEANALIGHRQLDATGIGRKRHLDVATSGRVLDGVAQQVVDDLLEP